MGKSIRHFILCIISAVKTEKNQETDLQTRSGKTQQDFLFGNTWCLAMDSKTFLCNMWYLALDSKTASKLVKTCSHNFPAQSWTANFSGHKHLKWNDLDLKSIIEILPFRSWESQVSGHKLNCQTMNDPCHLQLTLPARKITFVS